MDTTIYPSPAVVRSAGPGREGATQTLSSADCQLADLKQEYTYSFNAYFAGANWSAFIKPYRLVVKGKTLEELAKNAEEAVMELAEDLKARRTLTERQLIQVLEAEDCALVEPVERARRQVSCQTAAGEGAAPHH